MHRGYVPGTGLGVRSDGRLDPVPVRILPPGKSLDACMELRLLQGEHGDSSSAKDKKMKRKLFRRERAASARAVAGSNGPTDVFGFLNFAARRTALPTDGTANQRRGVAGAPAPPRDTGLQIISAQSQVCGALISEVVLWGS